MSDYNIGTYFICNNFMKTILYNKEDMILKIKEIVHIISESFKLKTKNIYFVIKYLIMSLPLSETENKLTLSSLEAVYFHLCCYP